MWYHCDAIGCCIGKKRVCSTALSILFHLIYYSLWFLKKCFKFKIDLGPTRPDPVLLCSLNQSIKKLGQYSFYWFTHLPWTLTLTQFSPKINQLELLLVSDKILKLYLENCGCCVTNRHTVYPQGEGRQYLIYSKLL